MELIPEPVQQYAEAFSSEEDDLLRELAARTRELHRDHHMLSGHLQGKWLQMVSWMIRPMRVLEIGTFTGYSAICLAAGMQTGGELHSIELRENDAQTARQFIARSSYADKITVHTGEAADLIPTLGAGWDLVFIDADKVSYTQYVDMVMPLVRTNGFILADNIFFHGEVLEQPAKGKNARAISRFNEYIRSRTDMDKMILTLRDGMFLIRKKPSAS